MTKVLFFGTHPKQFNGYSKVVYEFMKCNSIFKDNDIEFCVFGFQNFYKHPNHRLDTPSDVSVYDAFLNEDPKTQGFGFTNVRKYVNELKPDVCIIYNDMMVIHQIVTQLKLAQKEDGMKFKIIAYIDQVYLNQKKEFIDFVNQNADYAILFTEYWEKIIKEQGLTLPSTYLQHGFNPMVHFPVPKKLARKYFNMNENDFIIMNLNRNQPRKRWDICIKAFAEIVSRHIGEPIKLLIATAVQGAWNLIELYERELKKRDISLDEGMKHIILLDAPQMITDEETNILYNVADVGINMCDGEGFGLCNFEQAAIGIPQVVPNIGGFKDFFDETNAQLISPTMAYYVDNTRDSVCGEALLCDYGDFVEALEMYYANRELREQHATNARNKIVKSYKWEDLAKKLAYIVHTVVDVTPRIKKQSSKIAIPVIYEEDETDIKDIEDEVEKIDIASLPAVVSASVLPVMTDVDSNVVDTESTSVSKSSKKKSKKGRNKKELLDLQKKLAALLNTDDDDDDTDEEEQS